MIQAFYQFKDAQQERIYIKLHSLVGRGASAFYRDACRLMEMDNSLESTTHLVGHLLREIESSLRSVLVPITTPTSGQSNRIKCPSCSHKFTLEPQKPSHKDEIIAILQAINIPLSLVD